MGFCFPLIPFEEVVNTILEFPHQENGVGGVGEALMAKGRWDHSGN